MLSKKVIFTISFTIRSAIELDGVELASTFFATLDLQIRISALKLNTKITSKKKGIFYKIDNCSLKTRKNEFLLDDILRENINLCK